MVERPGGAIMTWYDNRAGEEDIYAQRIDTSGAVLWTPDGIAVCTETGDQEEVRAVPDKGGGAIILWIDWRSGERDLYAQRIGPDSTPMWAPGGVPVCTATGDQRRHDAIADGDGGMICVWRHGIEPDVDLYSQRIDANGLPVWAADGIPVCTETNAQLLPQLATDGNGGAFYAWMDRRNSTFYEHEIYTQRISAAGDVLWPAGGILIRGPVTGWDNWMPTIAPDDFCGAIIAWFTSEPLPGGRISAPTASSAEDIESIFAQRIAGDGTIWWQEGGVPLCDSPGFNAPRGQKILPDGTGGAVITWYNIFDPTGIYAQRINGQGNTPPTEAHTLAPSLTLSQNFPNPFNPSTTICFDLPDAAHVYLSVYNVKGKLVATLIDGYVTQGHKEIDWAARDKRGRPLSSGIYFYHLVAGGSVRTRKMVLLR
jgi:hypothetical protein